MYTSVAKKELLALLKEATSPEQRADIASRLARLEESESKTKARKQRMKAKREKAKADVAKATEKAAPKDDGNELFELDQPDPAEVAANVARLKRSTTHAPGTPEWEHRRRVREDLRKMGENIPWDRDIDGVPAEELPPPETHAERCTREFAERQAQGGNGWSRTLAALEPLEVFDRRVGAWLPSEAGHPYSSLGPQPGVDCGFPPIPDCIESNPWNAEEGWSWRAFDTSTGKYRETNDQQERERDADECAYRERAAKLYGV
jgi:hypothetical protein